MTLSSAGRDGDPCAVAGGDARGAVLEQFGQSVDGFAHGELHGERWHGGLEHGVLDGERGGGERCSTLATGSTLNYTENGGGERDQPVLTLADLDNPTQCRGRCRSRGTSPRAGHAGLYERAGDDGNHCGAYNAGTGVMTLSSAGPGTATTLAQWQVALRAVAVLEQFGHPSTSAKARSYTVNDGTANSKHDHLHGERGGGERCAGAGHGHGLNYTENAAATAREYAIRWRTGQRDAELRDGVDHGGLVSAEDALSFTNVPATMGNIAGAYNAARVMTLRSAGGTATPCAVAVALRACSTRTVLRIRRRGAHGELTVNDGAGNSNTVASTVNVAAVNERRCSRRGRR